MAYTLYPDADPESSTVDGTTTYSIVDGTWVQVHDQAVGDTAVSNGSTLGVSISSNGAGSKWGGIGRAITLFNGSSLTGLTPVSAVLYVYCQSKANTFASDSFAFNVFASNPASNTNLITADYSCLSSTELSTAISYANLVVGGWNTYTLNATGLALITSGIIKLGLRESLHDAANSAPTWELNKSVSVLFRSADGDSTTRPYLLVTAISGTEPRVTTIVDYFSSGWGNRPPSYKMELSLGGLSSIYASPMPDREPPPTVPLPSLPFRKFTPDQYAQWMNTHSLEQIIGIFGKWPTFTEWSAWYATYGGTTQLW